MAEGTITQKDILELMHKQLDFLKAMYLGTPTQVITSQWPAAVNINPSGEKTVG